MTVDDRKHVPFDSSSTFRGGISSAVRMPGDDSEPVGGRQASPEEVVAEVLKHKRDGFGKLIGLMGLPSSGKTAFADFAQARIMEQGKRHFASGKTHADDYGVIPISFGGDEHLLIDLAGEDLKFFSRWQGEDVPGVDSKALPPTIERVLWPILQELDGLVLFISLPMHWRAWNLMNEGYSGQGERKVPDPALKKQQEAEAELILNSQRTMLKYVRVAHDLERLRAKKKNLPLKNGDVPSRGVIDSASKSARPLRIPVYLAFSKADLFRTQQREHGLFAPQFRLGRKAQPRETPLLDPEFTDPLVLLRTHFRELFDALCDNARYFKVDFIQAFRDTSERPDEDQSVDEHIDDSALTGVQSAFEFLTTHPWSWYSPSVATMYKFDRWLDRVRGRKRWNLAGVLRGLEGEELREARKASADAAEEVEDSDD